VYVAIKTKVNKDIVKILKDLYFQYLNNKYKARITTIISGRVQMQNDMVKPYFIIVL
jgi:hypothetical protein